jgi:hypothetical protein
MLTLGKVNHLRKTANLRRVPDMFLFQETESDFRCNCLENKEKKLTCQVDGHTKFVEVWSGNRKILKVDKHYPILGYQIYVHLGL